jgi:mannose-6-phosphate isomerase-like protein (cupin superfamily)
LADLSRRQSLVLGTTAGLAVLASGDKARAEDAVTDAHPGSFAKESDYEGPKELHGLHGGKGAVTVRRFDFSGEAKPTNFVAFNIPPGASEGVHVHGIGLPAGPFDEYYYIASGTGVMQVDGETIPVKAGDHVHTPMGVHHGVENTAETGNLKVLVTFITKS